MGKPAYKDPSPVDVPEPCPLTGAVCPEPPAAAAAALGSRLSPSLTPHESKFPDLFHHEDMFIQSTCQDYTLTPVLGSEDECHRLSGEDDSRGTFSEEAMSIDPGEAGVWPEEKLGFLSTNKEMWPEEKLGLLSTDKDLPESPFLGKSAPEGVVDEGGTAAKPQASGSPPSGGELDSICSVMELGEEWEGEFVPGCVYTKATGARYIGDPPILDTSGYFHSGLDTDGDDCSLGEIEQSDEGSRSRSYTHKDREGDSSGLCSRCQEWDRKTKQEGPPRCPIKEDTASTSDSKEDKKPSDLKQRFLDGRIDILALLRPFKSKGPVLWFYTKG